MSASRLTKFLLLPELKLTDFKFKSTSPSCMYQSIRATRLNGIRLLEEDIPSNVIESASYSLSLPSRYDHHDIP